MKDKPKKHGRTDRVLVSVAMLEMAADACDRVCKWPDQGMEEELRTLRLFESILRDASKGEPTRPRAPNGHAIVPKALLRSAMRAINEGAGEFSDAAGYCKGDDVESCTTKSDEMTEIAVKIGRYAR